MKEYEIYASLVEKVLAKYGVYRDRHDYDDFAQELRLALYLEIDRLAEEAIEIENKEAYFVQLLQWKLKNLFRKQATNQSQPVEDQFLTVLPDKDTTLSSLDLLLSLEQVLTSRERLFLGLVLHHDVKEVSGFLGCSKRTVSRWLARIRNKLKANHLDDNT